MKMVYLIIRKLRRTTPLFQYNLHVATEWKKNINLMSFPDSIEIPSLEGLALCFP